MIENKHRVIQILATVMKVSAEDVRDADVFTEVKGWDSLNHLNFVMGVEREFGIRFDIQEVTMINSVSQTLAMIHKKQV